MACVYFFEFGRTASEAVIDILGVTFVFNLHMRAQGYRDYMKWRLPVC